MVFTACSSGPASETVSVMLLTGQSSKYHDWKLSSALVQKHLEAVDHFEVTKVISPPQGSDMSGFQPSFAGFDVIVLDYEGDAWPESTKRAFENFVKEGGGLVSVHATDNAFADWNAFNEMIGVGGWGGRGDDFGPKIHWFEGDLALLNTPGSAMHPPKHDFEVVTRDPDHPVMRGLPKRWMHANDEIYSRLRGPAINVTILATAQADMSLVDRGTPNHEPMLMDIRYGKGRVFHTTLGHCNQNDDMNVLSLNSVGFIVTLQRGTEWAATGEVTQAVPNDFPGPEAVSIRN
ncbi:MAG: trehalose utilization [Opitutales bacterium TMED158]|nr:MAG: trehalose utilization [Opitutales bacterium TMED158]